MGPGLPALGCVFHVVSGEDGHVSEGELAVAVNISQLGQLELGKFFAFSVINHIEAELFIKLAVFVFHDVSPP